MWISGAIGAADAALENVDGDQDADVASAGKHRPERDVEVGDDDEVGAEEDSDRSPGVVLLFVTREAKRTKWARCCLASTIPGREGTVWIALLAGAGGSGVCLSSVETSLVGVRVGWPEDCPT